MVTTGQKSVADIVNLLRQSRDKADFSVLSWLGCAMESDNRDSGVHILPIGTDLEFLRMPDCLTGKDRLRCCAPGNMSRRHGGLLFQRGIEVWRPVEGKKGSELKRRSSMGAHTLVVVLGWGNLAVDLVNGLHKKACPEMAVLGVDSIEVSRHITAFHVHSGSSGPSGRSDLSKQLLLVSAVG